MVLTQVVSGLMEMKGDGLANLWPASTLTAGLMLLFGCFNTAQFDTSLLWNVYLTIAAAFGVSTCMENTGVAWMIANKLISLGTSLGGDTPVLIAIYVATAILSELLTNNAVRSSAPAAPPSTVTANKRKEVASGCFGASSLTLTAEVILPQQAGLIMYPIAAIAGDKLDIDPRDMSIGEISACFRMPNSPPAVAKFIPEELTRGARAFRSARP